MPRKCQPGYRKPRRMLPTFTRMATEPHSSSSKRQYVASSIQRGAAASEARPAQDPSRLHRGDQGEPDSGRERTGQRPTDLAASGEVRTELAGGTCQGPQGRARRCHRVWRRAHGRAWLGTALLARPQPKGGRAMIATQPTRSLAKLLSHPLRVKTLIALTERKASCAELAKDFNVDPGTLAW